MVMAKSCDQARGMGAAMAVWSSHASEGKSARVRASPMVTVAIDAGLATAHHVHIYGHARGELGVGHGAEEREQSAGDPREIDQRGVTYGTHHLLRDKEDAAADDGANNDGSGLREAEHALERLGVALRGGGDGSGYGEGSGGRVFR